MSILMEGQQIRSFVLADQIGSSRMGEVWRASDSAGQIVVLKTVALDFQADPHFAARFQREAEEQRNLRHSAIVPIYDFFEEDNCLFLIMRYLSGGSLQDLVEREGKLSIRRAIEISVQVLGALDFAHQNGLIHRDVKPSNILLENDRAFLSDFGIALAIGKTRLTTGFCVMGTPEYMSPEQILDPLRVDHRADVYGFGCVLYEMLAGTPPFLGDPESGEFDVQRKHVHEAPIPLRERNPAVTVRLERIVMTSIAKSPEDRFTGCGSFGKALESVLPELETQALILLRKSKTEPPMPAAGSRVLRLSVPMNVISAMLAIAAPFAFLRQDARVAPAAAVGRLFIPVFSTYWGAQAYPGFASDYNRLISERSFRCPRQPVWFYWTFYLFQFLAAPVLVLVNQQIASCAFWVGALVLVQILIALQCSAVNQLAAARAGHAERQPEMGGIQVPG